MADFNAAMKKIREYEGDTYVNDPKDYGGETKCGIAKRYHPDIDIRSLVWEYPAPEGKISAMPIYRKEYWSKIGGDAIADQYLAESMMDIAVNISWKEAVRWAQHAFNELLLAADPDSADDLQEDGLAGPVTIAALNGYRRPWELAKMVEGFQFSYYMSRIQEHPDQRHFLRSWLARIDIRQGRGE
jgi:lysozyme family protein